MARTLVYCMALLLVAGAARGDDAKATKAATVAKEAKPTKDAKATADAKTAKDANAPKGDKVLSGMSIVGNDDAPKSLVIVPWKSAGLGDTLDVGSSLDDQARPVDRDVFARELDYYRIMAESQGGADSGQK